MFDRMPGRIVNLKSSQIPDVWSKFKRDKPDIEFLIQPEAGHKNYRISGPFLALLGPLYQHSWAEAINLFFRITLITLQLSAFILHYFFIYPNISGVAGYTRKTR